MPLPVPAARRSVKVELTARQIADLDLISARHFEAHRADFEEAKASQPTAAEVASALLDEAIRRELKPAKKKGNGR